MMNKNSGYSGYRMSNRAVSAYENGERPLSKWTKADILNDIKKRGFDNTLVNDLKKLSKKTLMSVALYKSSWHHTSSYCNETDFYAINDSRLYKITNKELKELYEQDAREKAAKKEPAADESYIADVEYIEWTGSKAHPKANKILLTGCKVTEKGCFYIIEHEGETIRKKIDSNGTYVHLTC